MSKIDLNDLYHTLHRLDRQMHRMDHRSEHEKGGLHHGQARLLLLAFQNDGASQGDLAFKLDVRPSSMTEMLTKLLKNNLIMRKQDERDQRVMHIYLTEEGKKEAIKITETENEYAKTFFQALTEDEQEQLFNLTQKLCLSLESYENQEDEDFCDGPDEFCPGGRP